jgi:DNA-binding response OmpR family regulator
MQAGKLKSRILIVDDEDAILELLEFNLNQAGFEVLKASDGKTALAQARSNPPDLIVLDLLLPEMDGTDVFKALRQDRATTQIPVIMLTAKATEIDRIVGLELGADDYITKPFSPRELVLRVKKLLRPQPNQLESIDHYEIGPLAIDVPRHQVSVNDQRVDLTATEFRLLLVLVQRRGRVQSRDQLLRDVWEYDNLLDTRTVDTHIRRLREKLGTAASFIGTVRNVGYRFVEHD